MARRVSFDWGLEIDGDFGNKGARGLAGLDAHLSIIPVSLLEIIIGASLMFGGGPEKKIHIPVSAYAGMRAYFGSNSRLYSGFGADVIGWDLVQKRMADSFFYGEVGYNIRGVTQVSLQPGISKNPLKNGYPDFWLRLAIDIPL
jgi:hypothetical protein